MIIADTSDAAFYRGIHPTLDRALELLNDEFLRSVGTETVHLDGDRLYATLNSYETVPLEDTFFEAHRRYLDIHVLIKGEERVDIANPEKLTEFEHRDDFYAYRGEGDQTVILRPGNFLVAFPGDAHRIKIQTFGPCAVEKVVFKILFE